MPRIRKAWECKLRGDHRNRGRVYHAKTRSKARYQAHLDWSDSRPNLRLAEIQVHRAPDRDLTLPDEHPCVQDLSTRQRGILSHALTQRVHKSYCTKRNDIDCLTLVEMGLMNGPLRAGFLHPDSGYFKLNWMGEHVALSMTPTYP